MSIEYLRGALNYLTLAREDIQTKKPLRYISCVNHAYACCEHSIRSYLLSQGYVEIEQMIGEELMVYAEGKVPYLTAKDWRKLDDLRILRGKTYHRAYTPSTDEARGALDLAEKIYKLTKEHVK